MTKFPLILNEHLEALPPTGQGATVHIAVRERGTHVLKSRHEGVSVQDVLDKIRETYVGE